MSINLPNGWKDFIGGGDAGSFCDDAPGFVWPPAAPAASTVTQTCDDVFAWNVDRNTPVIWTALGDPTCGAYGNNGEWADTGLFLEVNTGPTCYGIIDITPPPLACEKDFLEGDVSLYTSFKIVSGFPKFGICVWVPSVVSADQVTLIGLVVDVAAGTVGIYQWTNASLANLGALPTAFYVDNYTPADGDRLYLRIDQFPSSPFVNVEGGVYDINENNKVFLPTGGFSNGFIIPPLNFHVGYLAVASPVTGSALFFPTTTFSPCFGDYAPATAQLVVQKDVLSGFACAKFQFTYNYVENFACGAGAAYDIVVQVHLIDKVNCTGVPAGGSSAFSIRGTLLFQLDGGPFNCPGFCSDFGAGGGPLHIETDGSTIGNCPGCCPGGGNPNTGCCGPTDGSTVHVTFDYAPDDPEGVPVTVEFDIEQGFGQIYTPAMDYVSFRTAQMITDGCCPCTETIP